MLVHPQSLYDHVVDDSNGLDAGGLSAEINPQSTVTVSDQLRQSLLPIACIVAKASLSLSLSLSHLSCPTFLNIYRQSIHTYVETKGP